MSEATRLKRLAQGVCTDCGKELSGDVRKTVTGKLKRMCRICLKKNSDKQQKYREKRLKDGMCARCSVRPHKEGLKHCQNCVDYQKAAGKKWRKNNFFALRAVSAMSRKGGGVISGVRNRARVLWSLWKQQRGRCALTGVRLTRYNCWLDHIIPISRGGTNDKSNLRWLLKDVNQMKHGLLDEELFVICEQILEHRKKQ